MCVKFYEEWLHKGCPVYECSDYMYRINLGDEGGAAEYILDVSNMQQTRLEQRWLDDTTVVEDFGKTRQVRIVSM